MIRLLSKLAAESKMQGDSERRTGVYWPVHEDSSTEPTRQFASAVEFRKKSIKVAVGIIFNPNKQILIAKRGHTSSHSQKWELPGGKITQHETSTQALYREIKEELGITIIKCDFFTELKYSYPDKNVELIVYTITEYTGTPKCLENQLELKWVHSEELTKYDLLEANYQIVDLIINYLSTSSQSKSLSNSPS